MDWHRWSSVLDATTGPSSVCLQVFEVSRWQVAGNVPDDSRYTAEERSNARYLVHCLFIKHKKTLTRPPAHQDRQGINLPPPPNAGSFSPATSSCFEHGLEGFRGLRSHAWNILRFKAPCGSLRGGGHRFRGVVTVPFLTGESTREVEHTDQMGASSGRTVHSQAAWASVLTPGLYKGSLRGLRVLSVSPIGFAQ